jgi:TRAP-type mannitol/chloroaromatic compound transport system substrate-binding protein
LTEQIALIRVSYSKLYRLKLYPISSCCIQLQQAAEINAHFRSRMAEVLAVIAVVTEGAQMVDSVAKALKSTKDLFDSFEKTKDRSQEIIDAIVQAKNEIIARIDQKQFEDHRELLQANADFWFFDALPRLAQCAQQHLDFHSRSSRPTDIC